MPRFPHLKSEEYNNSTCLMGLLWRLNGLKHVKTSGQGLAHSTCSVSIDCYFYSPSTTPLKVVPTSFYYTPLFYFLCYTYYYLKPFYVNLFPGPCVYYLSPALDTTPIWQGPHLSHHVLSPALSKQGHLQWLAPFYRWEAWGSGRQYDLEQKEETITDLLLWVIPYAGCFPSVISKQPIF